MPSEIEPRVVSSGACEAFQDFDARQCECSKGEDKDKMLDIIRVAFGSVEEFNVAIKEMFRDLWGERVLKFNAPHVDARRELQLS